MQAIRAFIVPVIAAALTLTCGGGHPTRPSPTVVGSGTLATESWPVSGFSAISISGAGRLVIERAGHESLQVTAEDNILPLLAAEVHGGRLVIGPRPHTSLQTTREILYRLTVRDVSDIEASGAAWVEARDLDTDRLRLAFSGASVARLAGIADSQRADLSGASRLIADGLQSRQVVANVSGTSYALVRVTDWLAASASGMSTVEYIGDPELSLDVSGSSVVRRLWP